MQKSNNMRFLLFPCTGNITNVNYNNHVAILSFLKTIAEFLLDRWSIITNVNLTAQILK